MTDQTASTAPAAAHNPLVKGRCPACRGTSLFLGNGGYVTCARLDCPNPTAADELLHGEHADATAELARLRAGEEPGYDPHTVPTPGQWIARWNQASSQERLDVAGRIIENQAQAARCFEMNHEKRLADERKAWVIVARIRDVITDMEDITGARHWARILRKVVDGDEPAPGPAATQATDGAVCGVYQPPMKPEDSGLCARCGMYDHRHTQQAADAAGIDPVDPVDQHRRLKIELEHWQTVIVPELQRRRDRLAAALREILAVAFVPVSSHNGVRIGWTTPNPIHPDDYDRWNNALKEQP